MFSKAFLFRLLLVLSGTLALVLHTNIASAMSVQPLVLDMSVAGRDARSSIQVVNDSSKPLPVEFQIFKIELNAEGKKLEKPAGDEFLVFPPQAIVPPGATQIFRVQWVGDTALKKSQSYIFSVNQTPVKLSKKEAGVQIVFNFGVVVNVAPPGGQALLKEIKAEIGKDERGVRRPAILVENPGAMHAYMSEANIVIESGAWRHRIPATELRQLIGLGLVQPGKQRRFILPVDLPLGVSQISATLEYKPKTAK